ncbi:MAG: hypothetical protein ACOC44_04505 [Promethearchaeia archaeon]
MTSKPPSKGKNEENSSYQSFQNIVKISLILGIIVVSGFIIYYLLTPEPGIVGFGILNSEKKAEDYPKNITANEPIYFYAYVDNQLERSFTFVIKIFKGDNETELSSNGSENTDLNFTTEKTTLEPKKDWLSEKLSISYGVNGTGRILILELWEITTENQKEQFYDIVYLRLNITG